MNESRDIVFLIQKLYDTHHLSDQELFLILEYADQKQIKTIHRLAGETCRQTYGENVYLRALLEFTNYCRNNCLYCGIRHNNRKIERYRLSESEIFKSCRKAYQNGFRTFVLQGGEDPYFEKKLTKIISGLKDRFPESAVTLSTGETDYQTYEKYFKAGADRFLLRHETVSTDLYARLHPGMSFENRLRCLHDLKKIGFQTGAGFISGLPGQNNCLLARELCFLKELNPDMIGIGPLIPHPDTPLADMKTGSFEKTLLLISLIRLLLPETLIPVTTAMNTLDRQSWEKGILAGANVIMPVISPEKIRKNYEIYPDKAQTDTVQTVEIQERMKKINRKINMSKGDSLIWLKNQGGMKYERFYS